MEGTAVASKEELETAVKNAIMALNAIYDANALDGDIRSALEEVKAEIDMLLVSLK